MLGLLALNIVGTAFFLYISHLNYPGGQAMASLHKTEWQQNGNSILSVNKVAIVERKDACKVNISSQLYLGNSYKYMVF